MRAPYIPTTVYKNFPLPSIVGPKTAAPGAAAPLEPPLMRHWLFVVTALLSCTVSETLQLLQHIRLPATFSSPFSFDTLLKI